METVDVVVLFRIAGQVVQRKHGERANDPHFGRLELRPTGPEDGHKDQRDYRGGTRQQGAAHDGRTALPRRQVGLGRALDLLDMGDEAIAA